jgi:predicted glutamine amidotransferase
MVPEHMCRLFGLHAGDEPIRATFWLLDAPGSLAVQSERNPDGFGVATFEPDGSIDVEKRPVRAAGDEAFLREAHEECSRIYLAHVRYADTGAPLPANTHPFVQDGRVFAHNGVVGDLPRIERELGDARSLVAGDTDSERLFAAITKAIREHDGDVEAGIRTATGHLAAEVELYSLNFLLATPDELWALRYPEHNELFLLERAPGGPRGRHPLDETSEYGTLRLRSAEAVDRHVVVVASEPMDEDPAWAEVAPGELVHIGPDLRVSREVILPDPPAKPMELSGRAAVSQAQERA